VVITSTELNEYPGMCRVYCVIVLLCCCSAAATATVGAAATAEASVLTLLDALQQLEKYEHS
jgi:hypothetical protein